MKKGKVTFNNEEHTSNNKWFTCVLIIIVTLIPYNLIGEEFGNVLLALLGAAYLLYNTTINSNRKTQLKVDIYLMLLIILLFFSIISLRFSKNLLSSLNGVCLYLIIPIYYVIFNNFMNKDESYTKFLKTFIYTVCASSIFYILYQGVILGIRVHGNYGYANTYGLFLLITAYFNRIGKHNKATDILEVILISGIFFTESRNTLIYLLVFITFQFIVHKFYSQNRKMDFSVILNFLVSLISYMLLKLLGLGALIILPIVLLFIYFIMERFSIKIRNALIILFLVISSLLGITMNISLMNRVKKISIKTPVFQERLVYFEDAAKHILRNPLGSGVNSFQYNQYMDQSAFYDVKYIHNSILQIGYDMGIIPMIIFIFLIFYGAINILKYISLKESNFKYIGTSYYILYITIILHSLLDFDFSYGIMFIVLAFIMAFTRVEIHVFKFDKYRLNFKMISMFSVLAGVVTMYLTVVNLTMLIGDGFLKHKEYDKSIAAYNIGSKIFFNNFDAYMKTAEAYKYKSNEGSSIQEKEKYISLGKENLKIAERINPMDPRVYGNLAFISEILRDEEQCIKYYKEFLNREKYYYKIYALYYEYLRQQLENINSEDKNVNLVSKIYSKEFYEREILLLKTKYKENYNLVNKRSVYMNNQMTKSFDEILR